MVWSVPLNWTTIGPDLRFIRFYADVTLHKIATLVICYYKMWEADKQYQIFM